MLSWALAFVCQVVMKVVQMLPEGHRMKKEVDMALDTVSETMTPMHYHLREIIICTYRQVSLANSYHAFGGSLCSLPFHSAVKTDIDLFILGD